MALTFNQIPTDTLTPFMWVEIGERQNYDSLSTTVRALLIGGADEVEVKDANGKVVLVGNKPKKETNRDKILKILSVKEAEEKFGKDSELHKMVDYFFKNSIGHSVHCIGINTALETSLDSALSLIGEEVFHIIASTISDETFLALLKGKEANLDNKIEALLTLIDGREADSENKITGITGVKNTMEKRFNAMNMLGGTYLTALKGTVDEVKAMGNKVDSKHICFVDTGGQDDDKKIPSVIGAVVGNIVQSASSDPAIPFQFLELNGIKPAAIEERRDREKRQELLKAGVATLKEGNTVRIETLATTYKTSENGVADTRWNLLNKVLLASYIRADLTNYFTAKYGRAKLGEDGKNYAPNQKIMTPAIGKGELLGKLREYEYRGYIENVDGLADKIFVEKDGNTLKFSTEVDLMDQLKVIMGKILI